MSEFCHTVVCEFETIEPSSKALAVDFLCSRTKELIVDAGAASLLEASPCPFVAIETLQPTEQDTIEQIAHKFRICQRLGIEKFELKT